MAASRVSDGSRGCMITTQLQSANKIPEMLHITGCDRLPLSESTTPLQSPDAVQLYRTTRVLGAARSLQWGLEVIIAAAAISKTLKPQWGSR